MKNLLKHKASLKTYMLVFLVACTLQACDKITVYHRFLPVPTEGWLQSDTLCFDVATTDSQTQYRLSIEIRNLSHYPYQNLPLILTQLSPDSLQLPSDTLQLVLANTQGNWVGKGWGGLYQNSYPVKDIAIPQAGTYRFLIRHGLKDDRVAGIHDVGIKLEKLH